MTAYCQNQRLLRIAWNSNEDEMKEGLALISVTMGLNWSARTGAKLPGLGEKLCVLNLCAIPACGCGDAEDT
jgi:hypothetical protein